MASSTSVTVKEIEIKPFDISELTDTTVDGSGVLDKLLTTLRNNLNEEFDSGRISGSEFAQVFTELYQSTLTGAISFCMSRHKLAYELSNLENEGLLTAARIRELEENLKKIPLEMAYTTAQTAQVEYTTAAVLPADVANRTAQTLLTTTQKDSLIEEMTKIPVEIEVMQAQKKQIGTETLLVEENIKRVTAELAKTPVEVELLRKQALQIDAETLFTGKRGEQIVAEMEKIPQEILLLQQQIAQSRSTVLQTEANTDRIVKETLTKLPVEIENLAKQGIHMDAETALTKNQSALSAAQATKIPVDIEHTQAQIAHMAKQNLILEKDLDLKHGQLSIQVQELELAKQQLEIAKQDLALKREQIEVSRATTASNLAQAKLYTQKVVTEEAQTKGSVVEEGSVISLNNKVLQAQAEGYKRDAEQKAAKLFLDTWIASYSDGDREASASNGLYDPNIGKVINKLLSGIGAA